MHSIERANRNIAARILIAFSGGQIIALGNIDGVRSAFYTRLRRTSSD